ncbi:hypothetical protein [Simiduia agarivorans]|uniref:Uncharacterized protein n=1 Tax=Simiduia agarivorans (strain DSM 21679 / JCM 13881 / BCRC 17597 / SA1) TaxID=1117647 RepID=K4L3P8_SIMAS|nr:hypothetical protein [Simiduia agarivorans]AFV00828.1 hypothetical protein M5M_18495 [Simiduia agarivorans SA1 = DSM 21679]
MNRLILLLCLGAALPVVAEQRLDEAGRPCEEAVDLAERGQFHRLHFECAQKPEKAYDVPSPEAGEPVHVPGAEYHAKASFANAESVSDAVNELFSQMMTHCPKGWQKDREWVEATNEGFALFYQFTCSDL